MRFIRFFTTPASTTLQAQTWRGRPYPVIRYGSPEGDFVIDLIARLGDAFSFDDVQWEELPIEGIVVRVATPRMLYLMKRDTLRSQDRVDAENLRKRFELESGP